MRYKIGDRVRVKSLQWYNENHNDDYDVVFADGWHFSKPMSIFCGKELIIERIYDGVNLQHYVMRDNIFAWTDEMIEGLAEYPKIAIQGDPTRGVSVIDALIALGGENDKDSIATTKHACYFIDHESKIRSRLLENLPEGFKLYTLEEWRKENMEKENMEKENADKKKLLLGLVETKKGQELIPHKDYEIKQDGDKFYLVKKKKEYPKTYEECRKIMDIDTGFLLTSYDLDFWKGHLLTSLQKLYICRNAYWKIAGEEMGLDGPWEPDWEDDTTHKFIIHTIKDKIHCGVSLIKNHLLAFPTKEMRDDFKENFDPDIEICKEFL